MIRKELIIKFKVRFKEVEKREKRRNVKRWKRKQEEREKEEFSWMHWENFEMLQRQNLLLRINLHNASKLIVNQSGKEY